MCSKCISRASGLEEIPSLEIFQKIWFYLMVAFFIFYWNLIPNIILKYISPDDVKIMKMSTFRKVCFSHVRNLEKSHFLGSALFF